MALHREWLVPFATVISTHHVQGPAYGLGDQQVLFTHRFAEKILGARGLIVNRSAEITADHVHPECLSFRSLLGMLGISNYRDIDMNGKAALNIDLGKPLPTEYADTAGLVVDLGTLEHVFDIGEAFRNIVRMLRPGGTVIHFSPINAYNHGLWNINPQTLWGFYELNGFEILDEGVIWSPLYTLWSAFVGTIISCRTERMRAGSRVVMRISSKNKSLQRFCNFLFHPPRLYLFFAVRKRRPTPDVQTFYQVE